MLFLHHKHFHKTGKTDPYKVFNYLLQSRHAQNQYERKQCCESSCWRNIRNLLHKCKFQRWLIHDTIAEKFIQ